MSNLQQRNPQMANQIETMMNSGVDPSSMVKQTLRNFSPEQMTQVFNAAKQYGVPDNVISDLQNSIKNN